MLHHTTSHFDTSHVHTASFIHSRQEITKPRGSVIGWTPTTNKDMTQCPKVSYNIIKRVELPSLFQTCSHYAAISTMLLCTHCSLFFLSLFYYIPALTGKKKRIVPFSSGTLYCTLKWVVGMSDRGVQLHKDSDRGVMTSSSRNGDVLEGSFETPCAYCSA